MLPMAEGSRCVRGECQRYVLFMIACIYYKIKLEKKHLYPVAIRSIRVCVMATERMLSRVYDLSPIRLVLVDLVLDTDYFFFSLCPRISSC